jgi:Zn-dependent protease with chaperone function
VARTIYFDGQTAARHEIELRFGPIALQLVDATGKTLALWPYGRLGLLDAPTAARPATIGYAGAPDARLVIRNPAEWHELVRLAPVLAAPRERPADEKTLAIVAAGVLGLVAFALIGWRVWPPLADRIALALPEAFEERLGRAAIGELAPESDLCRNPAGQAQLDKLAEIFAGRTAYAGRVKIQVVKGPMVNAIALPGGRVVFFAGLIDQAESPEEIAGVMAHEIAHVVERHGLRMFVRGFALKLVTDFLLGGSNLAGAAAMFTTLAYSREMEDEADLRALRMLQDAQISTAGILSFLGRLERKESAAHTGFRYFSSHPLSGERRARIAAAKDDLPLALGASEWQAIKQICK